MMHRVIKRLARCSCEALRGRHRETAGERWGSRAEGDVVDDACCRDGLENYWTAAVTNLHFVRLFPLPRS